MIKLGNGQLDIAKWVRKHFRCDECESNRRPKARRPAAVPRTYRFNHVVGIDLIIIKNLEGKKEFWLNISCWGTNYQMVRRVQGDNSKTGENVWHTFADAWLRIFGHPEVVVCDPGSEFGGYFADM